MFAYFSPNFSFEQIQRQLLSYPDLPRVHSYQFLGVEINAPAEEIRTKCKEGHDAIAAFKQKYDIYNTPEAFYAFKANRGQGNQNFDKILDALHQFNERLTALEYLANNPEYREEYNQKLMAKLQPAPMNSKQQRADVQRSPTPSFRR